LIAFIRAYFEDTIRWVQDGIITRVMIGHAFKGTVLKPLAYHGWVVNLVLTGEGCFILIAGRRPEAKFDDVATLLGTLVRVSGSKNPALPPFQVVSRTGRLVAWGWRADGRDLSAIEQTDVLSAVLGPKARPSNWKDLN
jgi:hypothetical protein